jgi:hypothetical protein
MAKEETSRMYDVKQERVIQVEATSREDAQTKASRPSDGGFGYGIVLSEMFTNTHISPKPLTARQAAGARI